MRLGCAIEFSTCITEHERPSNEYTSVAKSEGSSFETASGSWPSCGEGGAEEAEGLGA